MSDESADLVAHLRMLELMGVRFVPAPPGRSAGRAPAAPRAPQRSAPPRDAQGPASTAESNPFLAAPRGREVVAPPAPVVLDESLDAIRDDLGDCRRCKLCEARKNIVFGDGPPRVELMFVGEGPGADEDAQGLPFVGAAGQLLNKIIVAMGLTREEVYIGNIVKCRPPGNRTPEEDEVRACSPFILRQIHSIKPRVVCALGLTAAQTLASSREPMGRMRGKLREITLGGHTTMFMATYHPAYLLRSPEKKKDVWEDVQKVMAFLRA